MQSHASTDAIYTACVDQLTNGLVLTITSRQDDGDFAFKAVSLPDQSGPFNTGYGLERLRRSQPIWTATLARRG